jgi:glutamate racemase
VFDSGLGGLSVLRAIRDALPQADLIYAADSAHAPYGDRDTATIQARSHAMVQALVQHGAGAIVVACNTASVVAVQSLRQAFQRPIVAIEPAIKPAVALSRSHVVGVLGTTQTMASAAVARLCAEHGQHTKILLQPCPGWVEQVERGALHSAATLQLVQASVAPLIAQGADTLVLGCTHYPFLAPVIRRVVGPAVTLLEPSAAVAKELVRRLGVPSTLALGAHVGSTRFFTTGDVKPMAALVAQLWGTAADVAALPF